MGGGGLEEGARINTALRDIYKKETLDAMRKRPDFASTLSRIRSSPSVVGANTPFICSKKSRNPAANHDHGVIYTGLNTLHRKELPDKERLGAGSNGGPKLPPVKDAIPMPIGGLWRWPGGTCLPADVESAVTAMTPSVAGSALSAMQWGSAVSGQLPDGRFKEPRIPEESSAVGSQAPSWIGQQALMDSIELARARRGEGAYRQ
eukprot:TRINITY_DN15753_c0_g1_i1.p1 TRINITY_DN15753_c0_g1~~TRINITY_DN15753_c0_g1_i1.p1  ORF type:complete len:205 (+),score=31.75 TRINITY_DN15753_c0_g1_i1:168-782(+)